MTTFATGGNDMFTLGPVADAAIALGLAWHRVEAALPAGFDGLELVSFPRPNGGIGYRATVTDASLADFTGYGESPAAALDALFELLPR